MQKDGAFTPEIIIAMGNAYDSAIAITDSFLIPPSHDAVARFIFGLAEHGHTSPAGMLLATRQWFWQNRRQHRAVIVHYANHPKPQETKQ